MNVRCAIGLWMLWGCAGEERPDTEEGAPASLAEEVELRIEEAATAGFSGAVSITAGGENLVQRGYGLADRESGTPNTAETAFDVGSLMKTFTAGAIYALQEDGVLASSDPLDRILPDVPPDKAGITLLQLVQHTAGFGEYHDTTGDFEAMTRLEARQHIFSQELLFEPGTDEAYSNSGYTLLADVIESVSGETFTDYVRERLFAPAGMEHSAFYSDALWATVDTAIGYDSSTFGANDPATWPYTWALVGNGGLVTTVGDLERFSVALWNGEILGPGALESLRAEYLAGGAVTVSGNTVYGQAGAGDFGLGGVFIDVPEARTRIAIATNTYDVFDVEALAVDLMSLLVGEP